MTWARSTCCQLATTRQTRQRGMGSILVLHTRSASTSRSVAKYAGSYGRGQAQRRTQRCVRALRRYPSSSWSLRSVSLVFGTDVQLARAETDTGPLNAPPVRSIITGSSAAPGSPRSHGNGGSGMGRSCRASAPCVRPRSGTAAAMIARYGRKISPTQTASSSLATTTMRTGCRWATSSRTTGSRPSRRTRTRSSRSFDVE